MVVAHVHGNSIQTSGCRNGMRGIIDNVTTVLLFALGAGAGRTLVSLRVSFALPDALACEMLFGAVMFVVVIICGHRAGSALMQSLFAMGVTWVGFVWSSWLLFPGRGSVTALSCAVMLAPAYLFVGIRRRRGIGMRAFVGTALLMLVLLGTRTWPSRHLGLEAYVALPPLVALLARLFIPQGERRIPPGFCQTCEYNLTDNVSGVCPECGTAVENEEQPPLLRGCG